MHSIFVASSATKVGPVAIGTVCCAHPRGVQDEGMYIWREHQSNHYWYIETETDYV